MKTLDVPTMEYAKLVDEVAQVLTARIEEAALPLHVLLASPFGSLNENQEEMLAAAQTALETADSEVRRFRTLLAIDRGDIVAVPRPIGIAELLKPTLAIAQARARSAHVTVRTDISSTAPRALADAMQVQAALTALLTHVVAQTVSGGEIRIAADEGAQGQIQITIQYAPRQREASEDSLDIKLARRLFLLQNGTITQDTQHLTVELPSDVPRRVAELPGI